MENYEELSTDDELHITSFRNTTIKAIAHIIQGQFNLLGKFIKISPGEEKDSVQLDKRNEPNTFIHKYWLPKTGIDEGIAKVFNEMKKEYVSDES